MTPLTALLLLALGAEPQAEAHFPGATAVFQCNFASSTSDEIYGWPPGWTRRRGPGFPRYVRVRLNSNHPPAGGRSLKVELDGGAAAAYGPDVPASPDVQYVLEGYVETAGLRHDGAYLSLIFLDSKRNKLDSFSSEKIVGTNGWQKICLGPLLPPSGTSSLLVGLHVEPQGQMQDLRGTASFGALWLGQLPHIVLTAQPVANVRPQQERTGRFVADEKRASGQTNETAFLLFPQGQPVEIACVVSGFAAPAYEIRLKLLDFDGRTLAEHQQHFNKKQTTSAYARTAWRLPQNARGFYRVRAAVAPIANSAPAADLNAGPMPQAEICLAIIKPQTLSPDSEFGWSLGTNAAKMDLPSLGKLLCQCGIRWVKFPFATSETTVPPPPDDSQQKSGNPARKNENVSALPKKGLSKETDETRLSAASLPKGPAANALEKLINFSDQLGMAGVHLAGVLQPPRVSEESGKTAFDLLAAEAFARDPKTWYPSIEPILARLATEIRYWQIGDDRDPGWMGCRDLPGTISRTKTELDRIGQDVAVGIPWNIAAPLPIAVPSTPPERSRNPKAAALAVAGPKGSKTPWRFLSLPCDESMGDDAMSQRLENTKAAGVVARWVVLDVLPREGHTARERIAHMVQRMLTAKIHGADAIFLSDPLDDRGLVDRNGSPSELFLPWRTTALLLGGAPYVGDIDLPQGNQLHCFGGEGNFVGVLAGREPGEETVYLGEKLQAHDLWGNGRACPPTIRGDDAPLGLSPAPQSVIAVEQLPSFLVGLDGPVTQWQLGVSLSPSQLPSIPNALAPITLELKNSFPQTVAGRISIRGPQNWYIEPRTAEFRLEPGTRWKQLLNVALPNDVVGGRQMVRLDFEIQADRLLRFTMYRPLEVTLGEVTFAGRAVLNDRGEMEVRQALTNRGKKPAMFRCDLLAPDRRRQSAEVLVVPSGQNELVFRLPDGEQLLGKAIWLRAEEIDGPRVLNYRIETPAATAPVTVPAEVPKHRQPGPSLVI